MNKELKEKIKSLELSFSVEVSINCTMPVTYEMAKKAMDDDWAIIKRWQTEGNHEKADYMTWTEEETNKRFIDDLKSEIDDWMDYDNFGDYLSGLTKDQLLKMIKIKIDKQDLLNQAVANFDSVPDYEFYLIEK